MSFQPNFTPSFLKILSLDFCSFHQIKKKKFDFLGVWRDVFLEISPHFINIFSYIPIRLWFYHLYFSRTSKIYLSWLSLNHFFCSNYFLFFLIYLFFLIFVSSILMRLIKTFILPYNFWPIHHTIAFSFVFHFVHNGNSFSNIKFLLNIDLFS